MLKERRPAESYSGHWTYCQCHVSTLGDTKKWELLKNPTKIEEIQEKKTNW